MADFVLSVKWGTKKFEDLPFTPDEQGLCSIRSRLFELTSVPTDRQKLLFKGSIIKSSLELVPNGAQLIMLGTPQNSVSVDASIDAARASESSPSSSSTGDKHTNRPLDAQIKIPIGLENLGNTCYLNATLQLLSTIPNVSEYFKDASKNTAKTSADKLEESLGDLLRQLSVPPTPDVFSINPSQFYKHFLAVYPHFFQLTSSLVPMQQDAEEALSNMLTLLRERPNSIGSHFTALFQGTLLTRTWSDEAPKEEPTVTKEPFFKLSCHISQSTTNLTLGISQSLSESFQKHSPSLQKQAVYQRESKIDSLPPMLLVHFIRFYWKPVEKIKAKILKKVQFSTELDLYEFCSQELQSVLLKNRDESDGSSKSGCYDLVGVLTHVGRTAESGHYISWIRDKSNHAIWWKMDDDKISQATQEDVLRLDGGGDWHMAYLCMYQLKKD